jgi:uncharacterized membrane protein
MSAFLFRFSNRNRRSQSFDPQTGVLFSATREKSQWQLARFLLIRGLWLVVLELTVVRWAWMFHVDFHLFLGGVLWALGWSMVALAGLVFLPTSLITILGVAMIALHNLSDGLDINKMGVFAGWWAILHRGKIVELLPGVYLRPVYALMPWIGVMAAGYGFGALWLWERKRRQRWLLAIGTGLCVAFVALRCLNLYGDPKPWSIQPDKALTICSFVKLYEVPSFAVVLVDDIGADIHTAGGL